MVNTLDKSTKKPEFLAENNLNGELCITDQEGILKDHHWILESPKSRYSKGICKYCDKTKTFDNYPPMIDYHKTKKPR